jgi:hypothetical protein
LVEVTFPDWPAWSARSRGQRTGAAGRSSASATASTGFCSPKRYADRGVVAIGPGPADSSDDDGSLLGTGARNDPLRLQQPNAAAVAALADGHHHHLIAARGDRFEALPLIDVVNRIRTIEPTSPALVAARALGLCLGE